MTPMQAAMSTWWTHGQSIRQPGSDWRYCDQKRSARVGRWAKPMRVHRDREQAHRLWKAVTFRQRQPADQDNLHASIA